MSHVTTPLLEIERVLPILEKISLFGGLTEKQLATLFRKLDVMHVAQDEYIFQQGDAPSHIYIVLRGRVRVFVSADGTPLELVEFNEGRCFGETSVIGVQPHTANAIAVEASDLMVLSRQALHTIFDEDKELFGMLILNIAREAARRLHAAEETLLHYFSHHER